MSTPNPFRFYNRVTVENHDGVSMMANRVLRASTVPELEVYQDEEPMRSFVPSSFMHNATRRSQAPRIIFDRSDFTPTKPDRPSEIRAVEKRLDLLEEENRSLRQQLEEIRVQGIPTDDIRKTAVVAQDSAQLFRARNSAFQAKDQTDNRFVQADTRHVQADTRHVQADTRHERRLDRLDLLSRNAASTTYLGACNSPLLSAGNPLKSPSVYAGASLASPISARKSGSPGTPFQRRSSSPAFHAMSPSGMSCFSAPQAFPQYAQSEVPSRQPYTAREFRQEYPSPSNPRQPDAARGSRSPRLRIFGKLAAPPLHTLTSTEELPSQTLTDSTKLDTRSRDGQCKPRRRGSSAVMPLQLGSRVTIGSLKTNSELNDQRATVLSFDPTTGRWRVRLDSGDIVRIALENLIVDDE